MNAGTNGSTTPHRSSPAKAQAPKAYNVVCLLVRIYCTIIVFTMLLVLL